MKAGWREGGRQRLGLHSGHNPCALCTLFREVEESTRVEPTIYIPILCTRCRKQPPPSPVSSANLPLTPPVPSSPCPSSLLLASPHTLPHHTPALAPDPAAAWTAAPSGPAP